MIAVHHLGGPLGTSCVGLGNAKRWRRLNVGNHYPEVHIRELSLSLCNLLCNFATFTLPHFHFCRKFRRTRSSKGAQPTNQPMMLTSAKISSRAIAQKGVVGQAATSLISAVGALTCASCSCPSLVCKCGSRQHADATSTNGGIRTYSSSTIAPAPAETIASIEQSFPGAVPNSTLLSTIKSRLAPHGYSADNTLVATSLCADEVNRTLEKDLADTFDMVRTSLSED